MPFSVHALNWKLLFSTELNGFSLNQLYRRSVEIDRDSPSLLIVKDVDQNVKINIFLKICSNDFL
jgi:hypothetical protein